MKKLVIFTVILTLLFSVATYAACEGVQPPTTDVDWSISSPTSCKDQEIFLKGEQSDVTISSTLSLQNVTLILNSSNTVGGVNFPSVAVSSGGILITNSTSGARTTITSTTQDPYMISIDGFAGGSSINLMETDLVGASVESNITAIIKNVNFIAGDIAYSRTIWLQAGANNSFIEDSNITGNTGSLQFAIQAVDITNLTVRNNTFVPEARANQFENCEDVVVNSNLFFKMDNTGVQLQDNCKNVEIINNYFNDLGDDSSVGSGIVLLAASNVSILNNVIHDVDKYGIIEFGTHARTNVNIENNTFENINTCDSAFAMAAGTASGVTFINNNISGGFTTGIAFSSTPGDHLITDNTVSGATYGLYFTTSAVNNVVTNTTIENSGTADVFSDSGALNYLLNTPYLTSAISGAGSEIATQYYVGVYVQDPENNPYPLASVGFYQTNGSLEASGTTDGTGYIATQSVIESIEDSSTRTYFSPYLINATAQAGFVYNTTTDHNLTGNQDLTMVIQGGEVPEFSTMLALFLAIVISIVGVTQIRKKTFSKN